MIAVDIETDGLNPRKNKIIGFSFSDEKQSQYIEHLRWNGIDFDIITSISTCATILDQLVCRDLIFHNAAFDCQFIKNYFGVDLLPSLHTDTMLMAHIINENEQSYGLKELSAKYLGADSKEEQTVLKTHLKDIGAGPKEFFKAAPDIIAKYAKKDVELTLSLYNYLLPKLENNLLYDEIMPLYKKVVIPMQARGVAVDIAKIDKYLTEICIDMDIIRKNIMAEISPHLEKFFIVYYPKNYPLKTRGKVADKVKSGLELFEAQKAVAIESGDIGFNILSKHHLSELFFDILHERPLSHTDKGRPQVNDEFLESMAEKYSWAKQLTLYNKLNKIKSTYYERFLDEAEDGIFYPAYYLHRTVSGRMSGDFQQLPRPLEHGESILLKYNNVIREFFIARPGCIIVDDDYDSLEPRCFAAEAGDKELIELFERGYDFYSTIGIIALNLSHKYSADKKAENYLGKLAKDIRQSSKAFSLGIRYGMDAYKLHKDLNIPKSQAETIIKGYFDGFPKLTVGMKKCKINMLTKGQVETRFGRIRHQSHIPIIYRKYGPTILDALELWKEFNESPAQYKQAKIDYKEIRHAINNSLNHGIQGLAGHILNRAAVAIADKFKELNLDAYIIACIHDEIVVECAEEQKDIVANIIKDLMENTTKIEVPLRAEPSFGYNLKESKG